MCGGGGQKQPLVQQQQAAAPPSRAEIEADIRKGDTKAAEERRRLLNRQGRKSTILTSSLGIGEDPNVARKTLLGA